MILAVFIVAVTFGTEPELKVNAVILRSAAYCAFVLGNASRSGIKALGRLGVFLWLLAGKNRCGTALILSR